MRINALLGSSTVEISKYFLGADINRQALARVNAYRAMLLGTNENLREAHLTILPPFRTTYAVASEINVGCSLASIKSDHPMHTTIFEMRGLEILEFDGEEFIVFPVVPHSTGEKWEAYVPRIRERLQEHNIPYVDPIPSEYRPHVTACPKDRIAKRVGVGKIIAQSKKERPLCFSITYLTLYAKYKNGYRMLGADPSKE